MTSRFDDSFFGGTVCGSWLALGGVAALAVGSVVVGRGSSNHGMTRGAIYGELKRLLRENKLRVTAIRVGTGKNFLVGLHGPDADLVARSLQSGGLRVGGGEPILLTRTPMSGDGSDRINPITLDFP